MSTVETKKLAKEIIDRAWSKLVNSGLGGNARYELEQALKAERREGRNPSFTRHGIEWAKAGLLDSVIKGATKTIQLGSLYGTRDAHVKAMIIGAAFSNTIKKAEFDSDLIRAARDWF